MNLRKSLTTVTTLSKTLALVLLITLPIIGFFLGMQYQKTVAETKQSDLIIKPTPTPDEITNQIPDDWKTYTNEEYGYQIKHPSSITPEKPEPASDTYLNKIMFGDQKDKYHFQVEVSDRSLNDQIEYEKWVNSHTFSTLLEEENFIFSGKPATRLVYTYQDETGKTVSSSTRIIIDSLDTSYVLIASTDDIDVILSTFKFLDEEELKVSHTETITLEWNTYTNEEFGFEFLYPSSLTENEGDFLVLIKNNLPNNNERFWIQKYPNYVLEKGRNIDTVQDFIERYTIYFSGYLDTDIRKISEEDTLIDGNNAKKTIYKMLNHDNASYEYLGRIYIELNRHENTVLLIGFEGKNITTLNQILSTFKFLEE